MDVECFKLEIANYSAMSCPTEIQSSFVPSWKTFQNIHTLLIHDRRAKNHQSSQSWSSSYNPSIHPGKEWIVSFVSFTTGDNPSCQGVNMKAASHWLKRPNGPRWSGVEACYLSARIPLRCIWCHLADFWSASATWLILDSNLTWWSLESLTTKKSHDVQSISSL